MSGCPSLQVSSPPLLFRVIIEMLFDRNKYYNHKETTAMATKPTNLLANLPNELTITKVVQHSSFNEIYTVYGE
jgi:hypothetical protein